MANYDSSCILTEAGERTFLDHQEKESSRAKRKAGLGLAGSLALLVLGGCFTSNLSAQDRQIASNNKAHLQGELMQVRRLYTTPGKEAEAVALARHALGAIGRAESDNFKGGSSISYEDFKKSFSAYTRDQ